MKKHLAIIMAAAMAFAAVPVTSASAADNSKSKDFVLFGDSIAEGSTRNGKIEHNYGEILADYYGGTVSNYAFSGDDSDQMLAKIKSLSNDQKKAVKDAECIVISVGGNDMIYYLCRKLLSYCAENNLLNEGYDINNIPERPSVNDLMEMLNIDGPNGLKGLASDVDKALEFLDAIKQATLNIRANRAGYDGYIHNHIMPNISEAVAQLKAINPDAQIVVQNIYQPLQLDNKFVEKTLGSSIATVVKSVRAYLEDVMAAFTDELNNQAAADGFLMADVYKNITALEEGVEPTIDTPGNAAYFIDIQVSDLKHKGDIHPNQKGHLSIASTIINTLGETHFDNGLLSDIYGDIEDKASYPAVALASYEAASGPVTAGDVNFDGIIDARDATVTLTGYANISIGMKGLKYKESLAADVINDGIVDGRDATSILTYYAKASAGKATTFDEFMKNAK